MATPMLHAVELESIDVDGGLIWIGNGEPDGAPSPLVNTVGVAFPISFGGIFRLRPQLNLFGTYYGLTDDESRAVPVEIEYADSVWVLSALLEPIAEFEFPLGDSFYLAAFAAPAFLFRIPTATWGDGTDERGAIMSYLYGNARFLYPEIGFQFTWAAFDSIHLGIRAKLLLPLFHLWDTEEVPFYDQMMFASSIVFRVVL